jgi:hypothetical protein
MNSSKAWGDNPEQELAGGDPEFRRPVVRAVVVLLGTIALALAAWTGWSMLNSREPLLVQALRGLLRQSLENPAGSIERMHRKILDTRVQIHALERRAGRNPNDDEARSELIRLYELLGMNQQAQFWRRAGG